MDRGCVPLSVGSREGVFILIRAFHDLGVDLYHALGRRAVLANDVH